MQNGCATGSARTLLVQEFKEWKNENKASLSLVSDSICDDGRVCLKLSLGRDKIFSLLCPAEYPEYEDNFFAESESVNHLWLNALNEFILDSDVGLTLEAILWKANSLDSRVRYSPSNSSDDEDENEEFMVLEEEDEEDLMERALWDKEKQWRAKEAKIRASMKEAEESGPSTSTGGGVKDQKSLQVFSNFAASGILTNDLKHIIKTASETGIDVEPIDSNIYEWSVRFSKFDPNSKLQQDLNLLKETHGIGYIELQLEFTMDLYPFYPPVTKMVRPRPEGSVRFMLACLDILKLSSWNPTCGMITVLEEIKDYLAKHAVLHVDTAFRSSILLPIENSLLQLALVSEVMPHEIAGAVARPKSGIYGSSSTSLTKSNPSSMSSLSGASGSSSVAGPSGVMGSSAASTADTSGASGTSMSSSSSTSSTSSTCSLVSDTSKTSMNGEDNDKVIPNPVNVFLLTNDKLTAPKSHPVFMSGPLTSSTFSEDYSLLKNKVMNALRQNIGKKPKFPDGTGYSTFSDKGWDINAHIAVEKEKDKKIEAVLQIILLDLQEYLQHYDRWLKPADEPMADGSEINDEAMVCNGHPSQPSATKTVPESTSSEAAQAQTVTSNDKSASPLGKDKVHFPNQSDATRQLYEALEASTLIPFIEQKLQVDSFLEICRHKSVYRCVIDILSLIAGRLWLARLLWKQPGQKKSIYSLLLGIKDKAQKVLDRYKIAAESSHSKNEKKGKKRANSGSRDKDKTTRRSKVGTASNSNPLGMDDSEEEAGPSGAINIHGAVDFNELHGLHGDYPLDDSDGSDVLAHFDEFGQGFPSSPNKKGVTTRSGWNLGKNQKAKSWNASAKGASGSSGKASSSATKSSSSATKSSSSTSKAAAASTAKASTSSPKASGSALKPAAAGPSKVPVSTKAPASASKASACFLSKPQMPSTSKAPAAMLNMDGPSGGISGLHFGSYKLKLFQGKQDPKKGGPSTSGSSSSSNSAAKGDEQLAQDFFDLALKVEKVIEQLGYPGCDSPEHSDDPLEMRRASVITSTSQVLNEELATKYISALKEMQFDSCDIDVSNSSSHTYIANFNSALPPGRAQMMRIAQELASFSTSLPLDLASAIFVRSDDAKMTLLKAMIIGPDGTPYASGCFLFDIFLPANYPKSPPKVTLRTTGRGTVRFNPNLYANGKVCLSLLDTWNGLQGEQWNETSTLLQVLVSIQSLIMVAEPYFNEPGYDSLMGTVDGKSASESYNHNVKLNTVRLAMIEMLKYPPADFQEVIKTHFRIKRRRIIQDIDDYLAAYPTLTSLAKSSKALKSELMKLKD
ncbi:uncharacterized protein LOC117648556 isoform X2 [Thrips palmi]|uniref:Uncharacterized protein LOC117648556 isoform X2 n=1 Tax=Thrips palmi TaxID=161013 RepID=A0A6P8ZCZ8_THRPL|nr:uncharacterized protein LOC117648556 isoform X2 [Thrips palmi]